MAGCKFPRARSLAITKSVSLKPTRASSKRLKEGMNSEYTMWLSAEMLFVMVIVVIVGLHISGNIYTKPSIHTHTHTHTYIYIYIYMYI